MSSESQIVESKSIKELDLDLGDELKSVNISNLVGGSTNHTKKNIDSLKFSGNNTLKFNGGLVGGAKPKKPVVDETKENEGKTDEKSIDETEEVNEEKTVDEEVNEEVNEGKIVDEEETEEENRFNNVNENEEKNETNTSKVDDEPVLEENEDRNTAEEEQENTTEEEQENTTEEANEENLSKVVDKELLNLTTLKNKFNEMLEEMRDNDELVEIEKIDNVEQLKLMLTLFDETKLRLNVLNKMITDGMISL